MYRRNVRVGGQELLWKSGRLKFEASSSARTVLLIYETFNYTMHRNVSHFSSVLAPRDCATVILLNQLSVQLHCDHSSMLFRAIKYQINIKRNLRNINYTVIG